MAWCHPTPEDWDHAHDLRKHEPRPGDPKTDVRASLPTANALAVLVKALDEADGARAIQKYADTIAAIRVERAVREVNVRITRILEGGFNPAKDEADAQA